jgi:hypothetical protein
LQTVGKNFYKEYKGKYIKKNVHSNISHTCMWTFPIMVLSAAFSKWNRQFSLLTNKWVINVRIMQQQQKTTTNKQKEKHEHKKKH